jgi:hypothetical protein
MRQVRTLTVFLVLVLFVSACSQSPSREARVDSGYSFFGVATLKEDGQLCLQMRTQEPGKPVAESYTCYKPDDPRYAEIHKHIGSISVGEQKVFGPFEK